MKILYFIVFMRPTVMADLKDWLILNWKPGKRGWLDGDQFICHSTGYWVFGSEMLNL